MNRGGAAQGLAVDSLLDSLRKEVAQSVAARGADMGLRVVIVDGVVDEREPYAEALANAGCRVEAFDDVDIAFVAMRKNPPDAVLTGAALTMDALKFAQAIREEPQLCQVAIVMVSAQIRKKARAEARMAGADAFFFLPAPPQEIVRTLRRAVSLREKRRRVEHRAP